MSKKSPRQNIIAQLDQLTGDIVKLRDGYQCYCQSRVVPQWGHLLSRKNYAIRWHLLNGNVQCRNCNGAHSNPSLTHRYINWHIARFGPDAYAQLMQLADSGNRAKEWTMNQLRDELKRKQELWKYLSSIRLYDDELLVEAGLWGDDIPVRLPLGPRYYSWRELKLGRKI